MRLSKLSRRQKVVRNFFVVALCIFWMAWHQGFPTRSYEALLQRAAGAYLMEAPVELLYVYEEKQFVYGMADGRLLRAGYEDELFGMQLNHSQLYPEGKRYVVHYNTHDYDKASDTYPLRFDGMLIGFLGDVATAEMDIQLVTYNSITMKEESREIKTIIGVREGNYNLRFPVVEDGRDGLNVNASLVSLRLYDKGGNLMEEKFYEPQDLFEEG